MSLLTITPKKISLLFTKFSIERHTDISLITLATVMKWLLIHVVTKYFAA